jgi:hypothetical protein
VDIHVRERDRVIVEIDVRKYDSYFADIHLRKGSSKFKTYDNVIDNLFGKVDHIVGDKTL